ncbi:amidohydrolase family protein [Paraburkholderia caribensis]|uniref:amidohydrolase family protein n=1 Tax=Paraburkholderia TaxID=1822464 RepID=UPI001CB156FD|nr:amidohydrolase family protein [Paraburkholderia caribensis]BEU21465.1 amidohydrolase family protein [Paraburkholderia sp. 22B1P]CAG9257418.1 Amidohydrolase 2 [Paraburkholderia caribensis]
MNARSQNSIGFDLPIFDAHHHFFDLSDGHYPWLTDAYDPQFFLGDYRAICRDFLPADYRAATAGFQVIGTVHVEAERSRREQVAENGFVARLNAREGLPSVAVAHVYFTQDDCAEVLAAHAADPLVRGVRSKPVTSTHAQASVRGEPGTMQDEAWLRGLAMLERFGLSWDLRVPYWHLEEAAEVARGVPDTVIVLNHLGLPLDRSDAGLAIWRRGVAALADCGNVHLKVSETGLKGGVWDSVSNRRVIREAVDMFGFSRSMFASNLPVGSLSASFEQMVADVVGALPAASEAQLRDLFAGTCRRVYRVPASTPISAF